MGFEGLLGNDRLKQNLAESLAKDRISHFYLISGPEGSGRHTLAKLLAAAILCRGNGVPCCGCEPCRKVLSDTHPDFITVDDPEKKTVSVDLIRQARSDIYIQPNESDHKIYLFPRAQDMGIPGQNALLKVLEEPPRYGVFILLTDNPEKLLPTVRSRCTELKLLPLPREQLLSHLEREFPNSGREALEAAVVRSGGFLGQAQALLRGEEETPPQTEQLVRALAAGDILELANTLVPMEKWKRDALSRILQQWLELTENALACRSGMAAVSPLSRQLSQARTPEDLLQICGNLKKALVYTQSNVSPAAVCGWLVWALG